MPQSHSKFGQVQVAKLGTCTVNIVLETTCDEFSPEDTDAMLQAWIDTSLETLQATD